MECALLYGRRRAVSLRTNRWFAVVLAIAICGLGVAAITHWLLVDSDYVQRKVGVSAQNSTDCPGAFNDAEISTVISDSHYNSNPTGFVDSLGHIHVFYRVGTGNSQGQTAISHAVSNNNGASWSISKVTLPSAPANYVPQNERCVLLRNGTLAMFITMTYSAGVPNQHSYFATSTDYGNSFSTWILVPETPFYTGSSSVGVTATDIREGQNGELLMTVDGWLSSSDTHRSSVLYKSSSLGDTWTTQTIASAPSTRDYSETTLTCWVTGSNAVTLEAWIRDENGGGTNGKLWYSTSTDDGATWSSLTEVTPPKYMRSLPDVFRIGNCAMITYRGNARGGTTMRAITHNNGRSWDSSATLYKNFYEYAHTMYDSNQNAILTILAYSSRAGIQSGTCKVVLRGH
jgi:hypothetical protein